VLTACFTAYFLALVATASALAGAARFGVSALAGSIAALLHDGSVRPMVPAEMRDAAADTGLWLAEQVVELHLP